MNIFDFLSSDAYITVNKKLMKLLGLQETILYCELISRYRYFKERKMDEYGWFFNTIEDLEDATTLSGHWQRKILSSLSNLGLVEVKNRGIPCKRYFRLNTDMNQIQVIFNRLELEKGLKSSSACGEQLEVNLVNNYKLTALTTGNASGEHLYNKKNAIRKNNKKNLIISSEKKLKKEDDEETLERKRRDRELKELNEWFKTNIWERYPKRHRVGETICFSKLKSAIRKGVTKEEILEGFDTYVNKIEILNISPGYIKRLDNWFASETWKNPDVCYTKNSANKDSKQKVVTPPEDIDETTGDFTIKARLRDLSIMKGYCSRSKAVNLSEKELRNYFSDSELKKLFDTRYWEKLGIDP